MRKSIDPPPFMLRALRSKPRIVLDHTGQRPYQRDGTRWLALTRGRSNALLADEPRVGKTCQFLRALPTTSECRAIVVCPAVSLLVWRDEIKRWRPDLIPVVNDGLKPPAIGEIVCVSYDSLPETRANWKFRLIPQDLANTWLCLDEVQYAMTDDAQRTRKVRLLSRQCDRTIGLTGTPAMGGIEQAWGILVTCGVSSEVAPDFPTFKRMVLNGSHAQRLRAVMLRRLRTDVDPELPPVIEQWVPIAVPEDCREELDRIYAQTEKTPDEIPPFHLVSAVRERLARARIPYAESLARLSANAGPLLILSCHREPISALGARLPSCGTILGDSPDRDETIRRFRSGEINILAMTDDTATVSVDLSRADQILEIDQNWSPGQTEQALARAQALGRRRGVHLMRLVTDHPLDQRVLAVRARKEREIARLLAPAPE